MSPSPRAAGVEGETRGNLMEEGAQLNSRAAAPPALPPFQSWAGLCGKGPSQAT